MGRTQKLLGDKGIGFIDAGVSGGIWGLTEGYGLMVGGSDDDVERAMPIFDTLRPPGPREDGFVHAGPVGAGHFAKMVHNGIEYALMTAYAEGYEMLAAEDLIEDPQAVYPGVDQRHGGAVVVAATAGQGAQGRSEARGDHRLHRGLRRRPVDRRGGHPAAGCRCRCIAASLFARFLSRQDDSPTMKAVSALRNQFGGHAGDSGSVSPDSCTFATSG